MQKYILTAVIFFILFFFFIDLKHQYSEGLLGSLKRRFDEYTVQATGKTSLIDSWDYYKNKFISKDGRIIDFQKHEVTTSEGQVYALRRALMINDRKTFDKVYECTKKHLNRENDELLAWLWGKKSIDNWGILDTNSASDADVEYAAVLILASKKWNEPDYLAHAKKILPDIWNKLTIDINGMRILASGDNQRKLTEVEINPSYFMPHEFRLFAEIDKERDWHKLIDSSYELVNYSIDNIPSGLPPDFFYINNNTGKIIFVENKSDFSYDAVRIFYRFYIDYILNDEKRAEKLLNRSHFFIDKWEQDRKFYTNYKQNGELKNDNEALGSIAVILPTIKLYNKDAALDIYKHKIHRAYKRLGYWADPLDYYAQNLIWFGSWLYLDRKNIKSFKY